MQRAPLTELGWKRAQDTSTTLSESRNPDTPSNAQLLQKLPTLVHHFQANNDICLRSNSSLQQHRCRTCFNLSELH